MNWIDIVIIAVLIIFVIVGCVKGFMFSVISLFGGTVNFIISLFLCTPMSNFLNKVFSLESSISSGFANNLSTMNGFDVVLSEFKSQQELSSHVNETINNSSLSNFTKGLLNNTVHITTENVAGTEVTLNNIISASFATFLTLVISFTIVFVLIYLILWILSAISKKARQVSDIRLTDRIFGILFGFIKGALAIVLVFGILSFFNENGLLSDLFGYIKESTIGNWLYSTVDGFVTKYIDLKEIAKDIIESL